VVAQQDGEWPEIDRRAFHRVSMRLLPARATSVHANRARLFSVRLVDLSGGGALIVSSEPLVSGAPIQIYIPPTFGTERIDVTAEVVRVLTGAKGWRAGIAFADLPERLRDRIIRRVMLEEMRGRRG
jgi:c-di-GMP-binding flagellar brake protein YcgR